MRGFRLGTYFVYPKGCKAKGFKIDAVSFEAAKSMFNEVEGIQDTSANRFKLWAERVS
jgi:hypothetical protein|tara:strand:+ start:282 stop:455 length:174 start_codon:yes stop_codon:yes gene_type:complete